MIVNGILIIAAYLVGCGLGMLAGVDAVLRSQEAGVKVTNWRQAFRWVIFKEARP